MEVYGIGYHIIHPKDPDLVRYAGKTTGTVRRREQGHWSDANRKRSNSRLQNWLIKYREDRGLIEFRKVKECYSAEELNAWEMGEIARLREIGQADLNITAGGDGGLGLPWSDESKAKLSATLGGEGAWKAKLTWGQVRAIRARYVAGGLWSTMLEEYGVARGTMQKIARNTTWVDPNYMPPSKDEIIKRGDTTRSHLTEEQAKGLRVRARQEVKTRKAWAKEYGVSVGVIDNVLQNTTYPDPYFDPMSALSPVERRPLRKLTGQDVLDIRKRATEGESSQALSAEFGVDVHTIRTAVKGDTWKHLPGANPNAYVPNRTELRKDPEKVEEVRRKNRSGVSMAKLAREYGVSLTTIRNAIIDGVVN